MRMRVLASAMFLFPFFLLAVRDALGPEMVRAEEDTDDLSGVEDEVAHHFRDML